MNLEATNEEYLRLWRLTRKLSEYINQITPLGGPMRNLTELEYELNKLLAGPTTIPNQMARRGIPARLL